MKFDRLDCSVNGFMRRISALAMTIAITASSLLGAPDARATMIPIAIDDIQIFIPCADFSGNAGVAGASVTVANKTTTTDSNGNYFIRCIKAGSHSISASKSGYSFTPGATPVVVAPGSHATMVNNFVASVALPPSVTYYFSDCQAGAHAGCVAGNNANAGTSAAAPKRNLSGFNVNALPAGAALLFARGGVWSDFRVMLKNLNVNSSQPLVFDAYTPAWGGTAAPWFKVAQFVGFEFGHFNDTDNDGGYTLRNLKLDGEMNGNSPWGLWLRDQVHHVTVENLEITRFAIGVHSSGGALPGVSSLTIRNSNIHHNSEHGMLGNANDMLIEGNTIADNNMDGGGFEHGIYLGGQGHNGIIRNNTFTNNSAPNGVCTGGNLTVHGQWDGLVIEGNTITQAASLGGCYGISVTDGYASVEYFRNLVIRGNTIVNLGGCSICIDSAPNVLVENNVIVNPLWGGITIPGLGAGAGDDAPSAATIRNNSIYFTQAEAAGVAIALRSNSGSSNRVVSNLVYFGANSHSNHRCFEETGPSNFTAFNNNLCHHAGGNGRWSSTHATLAAAQAAGFDTNGSSANPLITVPTSGNGWSMALQAGSPAINAGHATLSSTTDKLGMARSIPDIGAYEYGATAASRTLTTSVSGSGAITSAPAGINCGTTCSASYASGASVTLTAVPSSGHTFAGWGGACAGSAACTLTMSAARSVTAAFTANPPANHVLSATISGAGTVSSSPAGINCTANCSANFSAGTTVTLTANAAADRTFTGWSGACSGNGSCVLAMSAARSVTASFAATPVTGSATYYFSDCQTGAQAGCVAGNNANAGTSASAPKQTLAGVNLNTLPAGAQLLFARGGAWVNFTTNQADQLENLNVTPAQPMVFDAYSPAWGGTATPWLKTASGIAVELGGFNNVQNDGGYSFRNLKFDGLQSGNWGFWLRDNLRYVTIENVEITGFGIAIHSQGTAPSYVNHFTLRNSNIHHNNDMGILGKFHDSVIEGTVFESNNFSGSAFSHAIYFSGGDNNIIRNNSFINNSVANGTCNGGNVTFHGQSNGMLVENNTITQVASTGGCYGFSVTSGYDTPEWFRNYIIRGNTIVNLGYLAIAVHAAPGIVIENNVIRNSQTSLQYAVSVGANDGVVAAGDDVATGAIVRNNVVCYSQPNANSRTVVITAPATGTETGTIYRTGADASTGACASVGAPAAVLQASRLSGPAPLAVLFDSTGSSKANADAFRELTYSFNFGDANSGTWAIGGGSKNTQAGGPLAAHVFDVPGTYNVSVQVTDAAGTSSNANVAITVTDPDTVFAGTNTVCISASGNYSGCPAGALTQTGLVGAYANRRVLLRRGESFGAINPLHTDANFQVGAFGSGAKPIVAGVYTGMVNGVAAWANDFTIMDLNIGAGGVGIDATVSKLLLYRNDINTPNTNDAFQVNIGTAAGYYQSHGTGPVPGAIYWPKEVFIVENDIQGIVNANNEPGLAVMGFFTQSAVMGNTIDKVTEHSMRVWAAHKLFLGHNLFGGNHYAPDPPGIRAALKMHASGTNAYADTVAGSPLLATRFIVMADNTFGSATYNGSWIMGVGPQNADAGTIEKCEDIIMERNTFVRGPWTSQDFHFLAARVTTRDNVVAGGGALMYDMVTPAESSADPANDGWSGPYYGQAQ